MQTNIRNMTFTLALLAVCALGAGRFAATSAAKPSQAVHGAAAIEQLKQQGQYASLQTAVQAARRNVNHVAQSPLGRAAWHAPNAAAGYDAYVTEAGVSLVVGQAGSLSRQAGAQAGTGQDTILSHDQAVSLRLHSLGYGDALHVVAPGTVSGDQQAITITRDNLREWFVNGADGLEHGFTLDTPPQSAIRNPQSALRLALQVGAGWRAAAQADGQRVTLHGPNNQALNYGKLAVRDSQGRNIPAKLTVANAQVVIEAADHEAVYPLTIDPLFTLQQRLLANDGADFEYFGYAVALSGNTALVGAPDDDSVNQRGSVYVFVRNGNGWTQQTKLLAPNGANFDKFGWAVTLDGDTALIGAPAGSGPAHARQGAAYIFTRSGTVWTFRQKLNGNDGHAEAEFGWALALDGATALVGAPNQQIIPGGAHTGAAYVFTHNGASWTQQTRLTANDASNDRFGEAVALDADTALIGAPLDDVGTNSDQGSAYFFTRTGTTWTQLPRLNGSPTAAGDQFGNAVALSGDKALIGVYLYGSDDRGAFFTFRRGVAGGWTQFDRTFAPNPTAGAHFGVALALDGDLAVVGASLGLLTLGVDARTAYVYHVGVGDSALIRQLGPDVGSVEDRFGYAVAVDGDTVFVGAYQGDAASAGQNNQGTAYAFVLHDSRHAEQPKVFANDGATQDYFGNAVALDGDTLAVGAYEDDIGTTANQGSVYVFTRNGATWTFQQKLTANDGAASDNFGDALALSGNTLAVGAPFNNSGPLTDMGAVYVFTRNGTVWTQQPKILPNGGNAEDYFGGAVALSSDTLVVGAIGANADKGAVYIFIRTPGGWAPQARLGANDGAPGDEFGYAVALDGDTLAVGAWRDTVEAFAAQGSAYVFTRSGAAWTQQPKITANDGGPGDFFGAAVALKGDTLAVGAPRSSIGGNTQQGAAYVFNRAGTAWTFAQKLFASDGAARDNFGCAVALSGDLFVVGAQFGKVGTTSARGTAYVYTRLGNWVFQQKLAASDGASGDRFGTAVALSGDTVALGADSDDIGTNNSQGSVYVFANSRCPALTLQPASLPNGALGAAYDQQLSVSGGSPQEEFQFALASGAVPPGLTLAYGDGQLTGTPTTAGTYRFTVKASSTLSRCPSYRGYTVTITNCPAVTLNPATLPNGTTGAAYQQPLSLTGGAGPYSFAVMTGALPAGLTVSNNALSGTPTMAGAYNFTLRGTDANGCQATRAYTLTIAAAACPTITLNPVTLPNATVGMPYNQTLTATGGTAPYTFTLTAGALPGGVSLAANGRLSGAPATAGTANFTAQTSDANACTGTRAYALTVNQTPPQTRAKKGDFDGDGKADLTYWRGATSDWVVRRSSDGQLQTTPWGAGYAPYFDVIVPGDYDGDGKQDHAIWRGQDTLWYIRKSSDGQPLVQLWGANYAPYFDVPTPGDFDGDGKTDIAVWRPTDATFYVKRSSNQTNLVMTWGQAGDIPVAADYDGDGKCDFAVWRPSTGEWLIQKSSGGTQTTQWGAGYAPYFDVPVVGDYDGDGKADPAIWRGQDSLWYIRKSSDGQPLVQLWGANYAPYFDVPVPADYDGDGKADIAVWRPTDGVWYVKRSLDGTNFVQAHGQNGDTPAPAHGVK